MITRRDIAIALGVGLPLALATMLAFRFAPIFSEPLLVPNMPLEQFMALQAPEREAFLGRGLESLRPVAGFEKISYLLRARPGLYLTYWLILALPICGAIAFGAWVARREQPNSTPHTDARASSVREPPSARAGERGR